MKCSLFLFLFLPFLAMAGKDGESAEKKITREFNIQANGHLSIENKYGDIDIAIGEDNKIKFDISIKASAGSQKKAQDILDNISVDFEEGINRVDAVTHIESSSSWMSWFNTGSHEIEINYQVLVPREVFLELKNKYGSIYLENTERDAKVDLSYGDIRLGDINANLSLDMAYSQGSLSQIKEGQINLANSELKMENSQSLSVNMKYSELSMGSSGRLNLVSSYGETKSVDVEEVNYTGKYDNFHADHVKSIIADCNLTDVEVGGIASSGSFDMEYGDLSISNIGIGFKRLDISSSYTDVEISFQDGASYSIDAETTYSDINHSADLKVSEYIERTTSTTLKGSRGTGGGVVKAVMNYGDLNIK